MVAVPKPKRSPKKKRVKLESFKTLNNKARAAFNKFIREKYNNTCVTCGTTRNPTCSHLITSVKASTRFDPLNCVCQCKSCNYEHEYRPEKYTAWWLNKYGLAAYNDLVAKSNQVKKHTREELREIIRLCEQSTSRLD